MRGPIVALVVLTLTGCAAVVVGTEDEDGAGGSAQAVDAGHTPITVTGPLGPLPACTQDAGFPCYHDGSEACCGPFTDGGGPWDGCAFNAAGFPICPWDAGPD